MRGEEGRIQGRMCMCVGGEGKGKDGVIEVGPGVEDGERGCV